MARITLYEKSVTIARRLFRSKNGPQSTENWVMRRVSKGRYILNSLTVSSAQRKCRNVFGLAQKFVKADMSCRRRRRYWSREARRRKIADGHRAAVSFYMKAIKGGRITEDDLAVLGSWLTKSAKRPAASGFNDALNRCRLKMKERAGNCSSPFAAEGCCSLRQRRKRYAMTDLPVENFRKKKYSVVYLRSIISLASVAA